MYLKILKRRKHRSPVPKVTSQNLSKKVNQVLKGNSMSDFDIFVANTETMKCEYNYGRLHTHN